MRLKTALRISEGQLRLNKNVLIVAAIGLIFVVSMAAVRYQSRVPSSVVQCVADNSVARSLAIACNTRFQLRPLLGVPQCVDDHFGTETMDNARAFVEMGNRANALVAEYTAERGYPLPRAAGMTPDQLCLFADREISEGTGVGILLVEQ